MEPALHVGGTRRLGGVLLRAREQPFSRDGAGLGQRGPEFEGRQVGEGQ